MTIITASCFTDDLLERIASGTLFASCTPNNDNLLSLQDQHIKDSGLNKLLQTLCSPSAQPAIAINRITMLDLSRNDLTAASIQLLTQSCLFLGPNAIVRDLNLSANLLNDAAIHSLVAGIVAHSPGLCSLQLVHIEANPEITDACVDALLNLAVSDAGKNIHTLTLKNTSISCKNMELIEEAFQTKKLPTKRGDNNVSSVPDDSQVFPPPSLLEQQSHPELQQPQQSHPELQQPQQPQQPQPQQQQQQQQIQISSTICSERPQKSQFLASSASPAKFDFTKCTGTGHPLVQQSVDWKELHRSEAEKEMNRLRIHNLRSRETILQQPFSESNGASSSSRTTTTVAGYSETDSDHELAHTLFLEEYQQQMDKSVPARIGGLLVNTVRSVLPWNQRDNNSDAPRIVIPRPFGGTMQTPPPPPLAPSIRIQPQPTTGSYSSNGCALLNPADILNGTMMIPPNVQLQKWVLNQRLFDLQLSYYIHPISQFSGQKGSSACSLISLENVRLILEATRATSVPPPLEHHFVTAIHTGNQMYRAIGLNYSERDLACNVSMLMANESIFETLCLIPPRDNSDPYISVPNPEFGLETLPRLLDRLISDVQHFLVLHPDRPFTTGVFVSSSSDAMIGRTISAVFLPNRDGINLGDVLIFDSHAVFSHEYSVTWCVPHEQPEFVEEPIKTFLLNYLGDLSIVEFFHLGLTDSKPLQLCDSTISPTPL